MFVFYRVKFFVENFAEHPQVINLLEDARQRHTDFVRGFGVVSGRDREVKAVVRLIKLKLNSADTYAIYKANDLVSDSVEQSFFKSVDPVEQL